VGREWAQRIKLVLKQSEKPTHGRQNKKGSSKKAQSTDIPDRPFKDALEDHCDTISISKPGLKLEITEKYDESTAD
jgi:hypothetical protein